MSIQSIGLQKPQLIVNLDKAKPLDKTHNLALPIEYVYEKIALRVDDKPLNLGHLVGFFDPIGCIEILAAIILQDPFLACHLQYQDTKNRLIVARPLRELGACVRSRKLPSLRLVGRAIKALALSIFRRHLCDSVLIQVENSIFHDQKGRLESCTREKLKIDHPYLFQSALHYEFIPDRSLTKTQIKTNQIKVQSFDGHSERWCNIALKLAKKHSTLSTLLKSKQLKMLKKVAMP